MKATWLLAAAAALLVTTSAGHATVVNTTGAMTPVAGALDPIEKAAVYVYEGRRYCFYFDGWHGPGWYRCGFSWRRGLGWGGVYGWHDWEYGPAARRFGHGGRTLHEGRRNFEGGATVREHSTVRGREGLREGREFKERGSREGFSERREGKHNETVGVGGRAGVSAHDKIGGGASIKGSAGPSGIKGSGGASVGGDRGKRDGM